MPTRAPRGPRSSRRRHAPSLRSACRIRPHRHRRLVRGRERPCWPTTGGIPRRGRPPGVGDSIDDFHRKGHKYRSICGECAPPALLRRSVRLAALRDSNRSSARGVSLRDGAPGCRGESAQVVRLVPVIALEDRPAVELVADAAPVRDAGRSLGRTPAGDPLGQFTTRPSGAADVEMVMPRARRTSASSARSTSHVSVARRSSQRRPDSGLKRAMRRALRQAGRNVYPWPNRCPGPTGGATRCPRATAGWSQRFDEAAESLLSRVEHPKYAVRIVETLTADDAQRREGARLGLSAHTNERPVRWGRLDDRDQPLATKERAARITPAGSSASTAAGVRSSNCGFIPSSQARTTSADSTASSVCVTSYALRKHCSVSRSIGTRPSIQAMTRLTLPCRSAQPSADPPVSTAASVASPASRQLDSPPRVPAATVRLIDLNGPERLDEEPLSPIIAATPRGLLSMLSDQYIAA